MLPPAPRPDLDAHVTSARSLATAAVLATGTLALWFLSFDWTWLVLTAVSTSASAGLSLRMLRERRERTLSPDLAGWPSRRVEAELDGR